MKQAFISFDVDHDENLRDSLVTQAKNRDSPFNFNDCSVRESFDERWRQQVRAIIRKVNLVIFICGEHTHDAKGVSAEMSITQEEDKRYFLLRGRPKKTCKKPKGAKSSDEIHKWKWSKLEELIAGAR